MVMSVHALRYLWQTWWNLPGNWEQKKPILARLAACVRDYASNHPQADYSDLTDRFGTPQQIVEASLENMETAELARELRIRKKIVKIIAIATLFLVVLWAFGVGVSIVDSIIASGGTYVDEIEVIEHIVHEE